MFSSDKIETAAFEIQRLSNGIIRVEKKVGIELTTTHLDENYVIFKKMLTEDQGLFLIIFQLDCLSDAEFRSKMASKERSTIKKAEALVIKSLANRIESNFYINFNQPHYPIKVFNDEEKAIDWLLNFEK